MTVLSASITWRNSAALLALGVRCHAGRRGFRAHGGRDPQIGAGHPRPLVSRRAGAAETECRGAQAGEEFYTHFDPAGVFRWSGVEVGEAQVLGHYLLGHARHDAGTAIRRARRRLRGGRLQAGGHNAPPRGPLQLNALGEPIYGERDVADLPAIQSIGLPFWLAGGYATPDDFDLARQAGAVGVQIGTAFAFCDESDLPPDLKLQVLQASLAQEARVLTDPLASPTGFPFKVLQLAGTLSEQACYEARTRRCDLGYLRQAYRTEPGTLGWRCAAEPVEDYVDKGGKAEETQGRKCLCNALLSNIGLGQVLRDGSTEKPLITSGDDVAQVARFLQPGPCPTAPSM